MRGPSTFWDHNFPEKNYLLLYYIHMDNALPTRLNVRAPSLLDGVFPYLKERISMPVRYSVCILRIINYLFLFFFLH